MKDIFRGELVRTLAERYGITSPVWCRTCDDGVGKEVEENIRKAN